METMDDEAQKHPRLPLGGKVARPKAVTDEGAINTQAGWTVWTVHGIDNHA